jgi:hypothetical protein
VKETTSEGYDMKNTTSLMSHIKLRFNIDYPNLEECYAYGYECALAEVAQGENPYQIGTAEYEQWVEGWWDGFYGEKPLFEINHPKTANVRFYHVIGSALSSDFFTKVLKITGALAATAVVGYQMLDLVA